MTLRVVPDPDEPRGGFGYLVLARGNVPDAPVSVQVFDSYSDRWLGAPAGDGPISVGDGNWQSEAHAFGPYGTLRRDDELWVRIGPEIVNKIAEYTPLRITVAEHSADIIWPDDVLPRVAPALMGGIQSSAVPRPMTERRRANVAPDVEEPAEPVEDLTPEPVVAEETSNSRWFNWIIALAIVSAGLAYFFLFDKEHAPENSGIAYEPDNDTAPVAPCSFAALDQIIGGFSAVEDVLRSCGEKVSASDALRVLENGVRNEEPQALLLFGKIYDVQQKEDLIETTIGLTFDDDPAKAVEYYARARDAGSPAAQTLLIVTCQRLSKLTSTLAIGAHDDYCPQS